MIWTPLLKGTHRHEGSTGERRLKTPLRTLPSIIALAQGSERPALLDMGPGLGSNIEYFGKHGFKVFVEDFLRDQVPVKRRLPPDGDYLKYPPTSFDGVLCWDILDFTEPQDAAIVVRRLLDLLKPGGMILALFDAQSNPTLKQVLRHKITDDFWVLHEPVSELRPRPHPNAHRAIMKLFTSCDIVRSYYHKSRFREFLFQKDRGTVRR